MEMRRARRPNVPRSSMATQTDCAATGEATSKMDWRPIQGRGNELIGDTRKLHKMEEAYLQEWRI